MTQRFILDENVIILAQEGEDQSGKRDTTCLRLVEHIIEICHTLVLDHALWDKYYRQLSRPRHAHPLTGFRLIPVIAGAVRMAGKVDLRPGKAEPFPEEARIPTGSQDDVELVRLAVESGAPLVTTDDSLRDDLNACGVAEAYDLQLLSPREALDRL